MASHRIARSFWTAGSGTFVFRDECPDTITEDEFRRILEGHYKATFGQLIGRHREDLVVPSTAARAPARSPAPLEVELLRASCQMSELRR
jgi:hypothetical protein